MLTKIFESDQQFCLIFKGLSELFLVQAIITVVEVMRLICRGGNYATNT